MKNWKDHFDTVLEIKISKVPGNLKEFAERADWKKFFLSGYGAGMLRIFEEDGYLREAIEAGDLDDVFLCLFEKDWEDLTDGIEVDWERSECLYVSGYRIYGKDPDFSLDRPELHIANAWQTHDSIEIHDDFVGEWELGRTLCVIDWCGEKEYELLSGEYDGLSCWCSQGMDWDFAEYTDEFGLEEDFDFDDLRTMYMDCVNESQDDLSNYDLSAAETVNVRFEHVATLEDNASPDDIKCTPGHSYVLYISSKYEDYECWDAYKVLLPNVGTDAAKKIIEHLKEYSQKLSDYSSEYEEAYGEKLDVDVHNFVAMLYEMKVSKTAQVTETEAWQLANAAFAKANKQSDEPALPTTLGGREVLVCVGSLVGTDNIYEDRYGKYMYNCAVFSASSSEMKHLTANCVKIELAEEENRRMEDVCPTNNNEIIETPTTNMSEPVNPTVPAGARICPKCGANVKPNYKFCTKCGQPMTDATSAVSSTPNTDKATSADDNQKFLGLGRIFGGRDNKPTTAPVPSPTPASTPATAPTEAPATDTAPKPSVSGIDMVQGKAVWNMGPGQLARRVSEAEFNQLDDLKGVIIQEGVTAVVYADGKFVGMLAGGYYEFDEQPEKPQKTGSSAPREKKEDEQSSRGLLGRMFRFLSGKKKSESPESQKKRTDRAKQTTERIGTAKAVNVSLISTRIFDVLFGSEFDEQGNATFAPITVKTKMLDVQMGVSLQMQVNSINDFVVNYLTDKNSISIADVQRMLQSSIETLLNRVLRNLDYQAEGLPEELMEMIKGQIKKTVNERIHGMEVVQVLDITDRNADFDRFRAVERELFASEQELGFLQRTGEFRNRLAAETNNQEINGARNAEDLRYALSKINRDGLLHDDEMESFVELLESQKRLRNAKTEEDEHEALQDLRKCRLVKDEDVEVLRHMLENKQIERDEATELLRLRVFQSTSEARMKAENALSDMELKHRFEQENLTQEHSQASDISAARHRVEMTDLELAARRQTDSYNREQSQLDYEQERRRAQDELALQQQRTETEMSVLERKAEIARRNMQAMQDHEQKLEEMKHQAEAQRLQTEATMTQEQIVASHMKDLANLDATAQAEMAKMMGAGKTKEAEMLREQQERERKMYEQMMAMQAQNAQGQQMTAQQMQQQMMQMMQMMQSGMMQMGQNNFANQQQQFAQQQAMQQQRYDDMQQMKNEYREDAIRQQERMDHTQDSALSYTTRVTESTQENNKTVTVNSNVNAAPQTTFCPACGGRVTTDNGVCPLCGESLDL